MLKEKEFLDEWKKRLKRAAQWNDDQEIENLTQALRFYIHQTDIKPMRDSFHMKMNFFNSSLQLIPVYRKWFQEMSTLISLMRVAQSFKSKDFKEFVTRKLRNFDVVSFSDHEELEKLGHDSKNTD